MIDLSLITDVFKDLIKMFDEDRQDEFFCYKGNEKAIEKIKKRCTKNKNKIKATLDLFNFNKEDSKNEKQETLFYEALNDLISTLVGKGLSIWRLEQMAFQAIDPHTVLMLILLEEDQMLRIKIAKEEMEKEEWERYAKRLKELLTKMRAQWQSISITIENDYGKYHGLIAILNELKLKSTILATEKTELLAEIHATEKLLNKKGNAHGKNLADLEAKKTSLITERKELLKKLAEARNIKAGRARMLVLQDKKLQNDSSLTAVQTRLEAAKRASTTPPADLARLEESVAKAKSAGVELAESIRALKHYLQSKIDVPIMTHEEEQSMWSKQSEINDETKALEEKIAQAQSTFEKAQSHLMEKVEKLKGRQAIIVKEQQTVNEQIADLEKEIDRQKRELELKEVQERTMLGDIHLHERSLGIEDNDLTSGAHIQERNLNNKKKEAALALDLAEKERAALDGKVKRDSSELEKKKAELDALIAASAPEFEYEDLEIDVDTLTESLEGLREQLASATSKVEQANRELQALGSNNSVSDDGNALRQRWLGAEEGLRPRDTISLLSNQTPRPLIIVPPQTPPPPYSAVQRSDQDQHPAERPLEHQPRRGSH